MRPLWDQQPASITPHCRRQIGSMERVFVEVKAEFLILAAGGFTEGKRTLDPLMPSLALERNRTVDMRSDFTKSLKYIGSFAGSRHSLRSKLR